MVETKSAICNPQSAIRNPQFELPYFPISIAGPMPPKTGLWRHERPQYVRLTPPCEVGCPAAEPVEVWIRELLAGDIRKAYETLTIENPFPAIMGRVCFHPCQRECNRNDPSTRPDTRRGSLRTGLGGSVSINMLERWLADNVKRAEFKPWRPPSNKKVAVVGSGPAGLANAYFLGMLGYKVEVFEREREAGGLLRYGIPSYRLPKDVLDLEIKKLAGLGIKFRYNTEIDNTKFKQLLKRYDAVFVATGAHQGIKLGIKGDGAKGMIDGLEFLKSPLLPPLQRGGQDDHPPFLKGGKGGLRAHERTSKRANVVIIGGGNTAIDAARTAMRLGADSVIILYRRTRKEMPAFEKEVAEALHEGARIKFLTIPNRVITERGQVKGIECLKAKLGEPDASGRRRPVPIRGSEFFVKADIVITAIGETTEDIIPKKLLSNPKVFLGGDMTDQTRTVTTAIGSGKRAAIAMDCMFYGRDFNSIFEQIRSPGTNYVRMGEYLQLSRPHPFPPLNKGRVREGSPAHQYIVRTKDLNTYYFEPSEPAEYPMLPVTKRFKPNPFAEVLQRPDRKIANHELDRCMHCGRCTMCDNCYIFCPDAAICRASEGYDIDYELCKGCGICAVECPRAAMEMVFEEEYRVQRTENR